MKLTQLKSDYRDSQNFASFLLLHVFGVSINDKWLRQEWNFQNTLTKCQCICKVQACTARLYVSPGLFNRLSIKQVTYSYKFTKINYRTS